MTIDKLGPIDPVSKFNKTNKTGRIDKKEKADSINISEDAKSMSEVYKATEEVKLAPDIRLERIDEIKKKLQDPNYINRKVIESVADSIMDSFGI
ncbi:MAG: flagellar biosynthesis anti-sigma factor FlgM [Spirochaetales bacterium]|nr:flagellar biosynthesis anti-sigma factor FlgM [Spirochaetales bacterium]